LLVKDNNSTESVNLFLSIIGLSKVSQHTPFSIIIPPPSSAITPPETAVVVDISVTAIVVTTGF
jgi:hypothetical protein